MLSSLLNTPSPSGRKFTIWSRRSSVPGGCLSGDMQIYRPGNGWPLSLREFVTYQSGNVLTVGEASVISAQPPLDYIVHQPARLHRLATYTGRVLEATADQLLLTRDGWRRLGALGQHDSVAIVAEYPPVFGRGHADPEYLQLLPYLTAREASGDGTTGPIDDADVRAELEVAVAAKDDLVEALAGDGTAVRLRVRPGLPDGKSRVLDYLRMLGTHGVGPADQFIPDLIFGLGRDKLRLFLNRLFTVDADVESSGRIRYRTTSSRKARQVQHLLSRFGVNAIVRGFEKDGTLEAVDLEIPSKGDVLRFIDEIGFFGHKAERAEIVRERLYQMRMLDSVDRIGPIVFDRVWDISEIAPAPVYGLLFESARNFIANDFVVHAPVTGASWCSDWPADEVTETSCSVNTVADSDSDAEGEQVVSPRGRG